MNTLPRILRLGLLIPVAFISMAGVIVAVVITYRSWQFEKAAREAQKQAIESHVLLESAKIAEEVYLGLDNWQAREKQIATYFQGKGARTKLRFEPASGVDVQPNEGQRVMRWEGLEGELGEERLRVPLYFSDLFVGTVFVDVTWGTAWTLDGFVDLSAAVLMPVLLVILLWLVTFLLLKKKVIGPFLEQMMRLNRLEAISETTQMIAHDIRKPFHMMRLGLQALKKSAASSSDVRLRRLTDEMTPTIEKISAEVDDMLRDIVDLEKPQTLHAAEASLSEMIAALVADHKKQCDERDATVSVQLNHVHVAMIDKFKIQRVLTNLLQNAFQAVERNGKVWVNTIERDSRKARREIVVCIGNSGSIIAKNDIARLFDRFFSKGKQNGTGLGLAIAMKFVKAHGGEIWCESSAGTGTQFFFSVPASTSVEERGMPKVYLKPTEAAAKLGALTDQNYDCGRPQGEEGPTPPRRQAEHVALIGDDAFFRDGMKVLLETLPDPSLSQVRVVGSYTIAEAARMETGLSKTRLVVVDFENERELAPIASMLQRLSRSTLLCIHARSDSDSFSENIGSNCVHLIKPVGFSQVESILKTPHGAQ